MSSRQLLVNLTLLHFMVYYEIPPIQIKVTLLKRNIIISIHNRMRMHGTLYRIHTCMCVEPQVFLVGWLVNIRERRRGDEVAKWWLLEYILIGFVYSYTLGRCLSLSRCYYTAHYIVLQVREREKETNSGWLVGCWWSGGDRSIQAEPKESH